MPLMRTLLKRLHTSRLGKLTMGERPLRGLVIQNTAWLIAGQLVSKALKFIVLAYAARVLGVDAIGSLTYATAIITLSFTFSDVGLSPLLIREYGKAEDGAHLLRTMLRAKAWLILASSLIAGGAYIVFSGVSTSLFILTLGVMVADVAREFLTTIARAKEKAHQEALILGIEGITTLLLGIGVLIAHPTVTSLATAYWMVSALTLGTTYFLFRTHLTKSTPSARIRARDLVKEMWPFAAAAGIAVAFTQVDAVMVGWLKGSQAAGLYGAGSRIASLFLMLPALLGNALLPGLTRLKEDTVKQAVLARESLSGVLLFALPITVGGIYTASELLRLIYGPAFGPGGNAFALLLISCCFFAITTILDFVLLARGLQVTNFIYTSIAAGINLILNMVLIPHYGALGAGIASALAQLVNVTLTYTFTRSVMKTSLIPWRDLLHFGSASLAMLVTIAVLPLPVWGSILLGATTYFAILGFSRPPLVTSLFPRR
jgi:O-antigen/teichoic acid export membrane protein